MNNGQDGSRSGWVTTAGGIALLYAILGALWIILSDLVFLGRFELLLTSTIKGLSFVAITAGLLYLLIRVSRQALEASRQSLEESEERLELAIEGANLATWDWNIPTGRLIFNERWATMLGYEPGELEPHYRTWESLAHPEDLPVAKTALAEHWAGRSEQYEAEHRLRHKAGGWIWVVARGKVTEWSFDRRPLRMCGTHLDISKEKRLAERLIQSEKMEAVGRLAGGIAHDFNNLLTVIIGYAELLSLNSPSNAETAGKILQAAGRAKDLTQQLLAFSRRQVLQPRDISIRSHLEGVQDLLRRLISEDIQLVFSLDPDAGQVRVDPAQLTQVIMNLAVNARDAMPSGGALTIRTRRVHLDSSYAAAHPDASPGEYVELAVSDTGMGMDRQTLAQIFEPFFTTKSPGKGTGLGLSTVYGIIRQSGGHIVVESEPGRGTTFLVYLPLVDSTSGSSPTAAMNPRTLSGTETVLIVEDSPEIRRMMADVFQGHGYRVLQADSPEKAVQLVSVGIDDLALVVTDVVMPRMNGRDLARKLRSLQSGLPVLLISGYADNVVDAANLEPGTYFLAKPFTPTALLAKTREILDRSRLTPGPAGV